MDVLHSGIIQTFFLILISATFTDNILLTRFLGMCSCLGVSKKVDTSLGLGLAVIFVTTCTAAINFLVYEFLLIPLGIAYLKLIVFIIVIAAFVQFVEMVIERVSIKLYFSLGIFLPLITVNCAILGTSLFMLNKPYSLLQAFAFGLGSGLGWFLAITIIGGIREKVNEASVPRGLEGPGITLIIIGIMALAFVGFSGMIKI
ncbi:MAG: NADH:ubiquinone reductase (Na(+)-transporting) subunit E [Deltaproteobacteria bacterium]|nr:NADH:ubiquinone reductase (Na(+)-transporting) subunit E [Deltaproteobacteria bacterium]MBW1958822.1 NADH:ubiquinone reductase (Na(+)-transporting) subunit E [Deltaproteobacteria bacterium]MBW2014108.1 NADH:ubiquinone reductase (Na(+)-transporting) subunit E [Deltaproteobacteria bacterium]MBW2089434.1 NADH:ubiquinone reductase (Na(+)-transporting) subunit E [Deltaproteobacteria bacterium]MBW2321436.1 NADH:ubiquinone reductase (Na(+)-transporting) subunit E [Deltaproteobacteria bacterium]